jgi:hypothetical protein
MVWSGTQGRRPRGSDRLGADRESLDIERGGAFRFQHAPVDDDPRGAALLADGEGRDDDVGQAAILLERGGMADQRYCL